MKNKFSSCNSPLPNLLSMPYFGENAIVLYWRSMQYACKSCFTASRLLRMKNSRRGSLTLSFLAVIKVSWAVLLHIIELVFEISYFCSFKMVLFIMLFELMFKWKLNFTPHPITVFYIFFQLDRYSTALTPNTICL